METHFSPVTGHTVPNTAWNGKPALQGKALSTPGEIQAGPRCGVWCRPSAWWVLRAAVPGCSGVLPLLQQLQAASRCASPPGPSGNFPTVSPSLMLPPHPLATETLPSSEPAPPSTLPLPSRTSPHAWRPSTYLLSKAHVHVHLVTCRPRAPLPLDLGLPNHVREVCSVNGSSSVWGRVWLCQISDAPATLVTLRISTRSSRRGSVVNESD